MALRRASRVMVSHNAGPWVVMSSSGVVVGSMVGVFLLLVQIK
jgi:hypothetical protein